MSVRWRSASSPYSRTSLRHCGSIRCKRITDDLEKKYGLHPKDRKQGEAWQLSPVDASRSDLKKQVANAVKPLTTMYKFQSFGEFRTLLSLYNVGVEKIEGDNQGRQYTGLVYSALDTDGNRVGKPLKSSLFGKSYSIEALEQTMKQSGEEIKINKQAAKTKALVSASLNGSRNGDEFRANLREKGIDLMLRYGNGGRLFGVTFIDHNSRTVLNGSTLGKEFSANALGARFADFSILFISQCYSMNKSTVYSGLPIQRQAILLHGNSPASQNIGFNLRHSQLQAATSIAV